MYQNLSNRAKSTHRNFNDLKFRLLLLIKLKINQLSTQLIKLEDMITK